MRMRSIYSIRHLAVVALLMALAATAQCIEIANVYSNIDSADISLEGTAEDVLVQVDLIQDNDVLKTETLQVDSAGTYIVRWPEIYAKRGSYSVCATLQGNETRGGTAQSIQSEKCYRFYYGGVEPVRFDVRDFRADSRGMHMAISARDPTIVDIYYMLIDEDRALYVTRERAVPIAGTQFQSIERDHEWKPILENGQVYDGRVKIVELNHNQIRAFMSTFTATEDAQISETYQDETGASATVIGNSRVPFEGYLRFTLSQEGDVLNVIEKKTPVLLTGDDETVEVTWNSTLDSGVYQLQTALIGQDGDIMDLQENIIEAKPPVRSNISDDAEEAGFPSALAGLVLLIAVLCRRMRR